MSVWLNWTMGLRVMKSVSWILLVYLLSLLAYAEEIQEQEVERLIRELQDADSDVRSNAADVQIVDMSIRTTGKQVTLL